MKNKIIQISQLLKILGKLKSENKKISLCHGVFDLLHPGHINHFEQAKKNSDILVVSVTADKEVIKGPGKPYFKEQLRMKSLASLEVIDYVIISKERSAVNNIKQIKPNFYFKGTDYKNLNNDITGKINLEKREVERNGGQLLYTTGQTFSSSEIINKEFFYDKDQNNFLKKLKKKYHVKTILNYLEKLKSNTPLVLGETIIDEYVFCRAMGKSGKESYMVMHEKKREHYLGGVLSIAQNLAAISKKVNLLTALGAIDSFKTKIQKELKKNIKFKFISKKNSPTILKKRFIEEVDNTKLLGIYSIDEKNHLNIEDKKLIGNFKNFLSTTDLIIVSDYGHGFFNKKLRNEIYSTKKFLAINAQVNSFSIGYHTITNYKKADLLLMNETEIRHELKDRDKELSNLDLIKKIQQRIKCKFIAITHGKKVRPYIQQKSKELVKVPAFARQVVDKVGAGDALFPILATCLKSKVPMDISLYIASISAAINSESYASKNILDKIYFKKFLEHSLK